MTPTDPPFRKDSSLELTAVRPRPDLPPVSTVPGPTIEHLAQIKAVSDAERARRDAQDEIGTLVSCPWCVGCAMVTPEKASEWLVKYPELTPEPIPPSRPEGA